MIPRFVHKTENELRKYRRRIYYKTDKLHVQAEQDFLAGRNSDGDCALAWVQDEAEVVNKIYDALRLLKDIFG